MTKALKLQRTTLTSLVAALSLLLTGCFLTPGQFDSTLTLNKDNTFAFTYEGEIFFLPLSPGAMKDAAGSSAEFGGGYCFDDETYEERTCTEEEVAQQKSDWEAEQADNAKRDEQRAKQVAAYMGGIDPGDPDAGNKIAQMLERQHGWNSVQYKGNGVFQVSYAITGPLSHDITFPVIEGIPSLTPFLQVILRDDKVVRVNAPGFAGQNGENPVAGLLMGGFMQGINEEIQKEAEEGGNGIPAMRGTFRIVTDGKLLANNTDEGPVSSNGRETLSWNVSAATANAPTALVKLGD